MLISASFFIGCTFKGSKWNPILTWSFNLLVLFVNEYYDGYRFSRMLGSSWQWLDDLEGFQARWHILFNFAMLRLVSFNMDYYWACRSTYEGLKDHPEYEVPRQDKDRINNPLMDNQYNYLNFLAYILYTPLLLCGPIITYNDFISQVIVLILCNYIIFTKLYSLYSFNSVRVTCQNVTSGFMHCV